MIERMRPSEWLEIAAMIADTWRVADGLSVDTLKRWHAELADLPAEQVAAAVQVWSREGREYPPNSPGQIRAKVIELAIDATPWGEVVAALRRCAFKNPRAHASIEVRDELQDRVRAIAREAEEAREAGTLTRARADELHERLMAAEHECVTRSYVDERQAALDAEHPLIGQFVAAHGWPQITTGLGGGSDEARLRDKWRAFCDRVHRDAACVGLPPVGLRALERVNGNGGARQIGPAVKTITRQLERGRAA